MNNYKRIVKATLFVFLMFVLVTIVSCDMEALNKNGFCYLYKNDADDVPVQNSISYERFIEISVILET